MVQATCAGVASNSVWNVFRPTETTVMSRMDMIAPSTTTPATIRTCRSSLSLAGAGLTSSAGSFGERLVDTRKGYGPRLLSCTSFSRDLDVTSVASGGELLDRSDQL